LEQMSSKEKTLRFTSTLSAKALRQRIETSVAEANRALATKAKGSVEWRLVELWDRIELRWLVRWGRGGPAVVFVGTVASTPEGSVLSGEFRESLGWRVFRWVPALYSAALIGFVITKLWDRLTIHDWPLAAFFGTPFAFFVGLALLARSGRRRLDREALQILRDATIVETARADVA